MVTLTAIFGLVLLVVLILIAIRMISVKRPPEEEITIGGPGPLIHASGIYSIVRKSPREALAKIRPPESEIRKYLASINEDIHKRELNHFDKIKILERWQHLMEEHIKAVEEGDKEEAEFYYYDFPNEKECPVCSPYLKKGQFVSRQEIFKNPAIIPPFHLGCSTRLVSFHGKENLRETTILGMTPFFQDSGPPDFPEWTKTVKLS